jgi:hypothetical protein
MGLLMARIQSYIERVFRSNNVALLGKVLANSPREEVTPFSVAHGFEPERELG